MMSEEKTGERMHARYIEKRRKEENLKFRWPKVLSCISSLVWFLSRGGRQCLPTAFGTRTMHHVRF